MMIIKGKSDDDDDEDDHSDAPHIVRVHNKYN